MVDLKELQKEIDNLLDNETDESLLNWYMSKRFPDYKTILGAGEFYNSGLKPMCIEVGQATVYTPINIDKASVTIENQYSMAA